MRQIKRGNASLRTITSDTYHSIRKRLRIFRYVGFKNETSSILFKFRLFLMLVLLAPLFCGSFVHTLLVPFFLRRTNRCLLELFFQALAPKCLTILFFSFIFFLFPLSLAFFLLPLALGFLLTPKSLIIFFFLMSISIAILFFILGS